MEHSILYFLSKPLGKWRDRVSWCSYCLFSSVSCMHFLTTKVNPDEWGELVSYSFPSASIWNKATFNHTSSLLCTVLTVCPLNSEAFIYHLTPIPWCEVFPTLQLLHWNVHLAPALMQVSRVTGKTIFQGVWIWVHTHILMFTLLCTSVTQKLDCKKSISVFFVGIS